MSGESGNRVRTATVARVGQPVKGTDGLEEGSTQDRRKKKKEEEEEQAASKQPQVRKAFTCGRTPFIIYNPNQSIY